MINLNSKIFIAGHNGMVGTAIFKKLSEDPNNKILVRSRKELDLQNQHMVENFFRSNDIQEVTGHKPSYPLIGDKDLGVSKLYGMLPTESGSDSTGRTAVDNQTVRNVYIVGPDKKIKLILTYPMATGRNFDEILRVIDSLKLTVEHKVATPANWKQGDDCLLYTSPSPRDLAVSRMPSSA